MLKIPLRLWGENVEGKWCDRIDGLDKIYRKKGIMGMAGAGYGAYIPRLRLKVDDIWDVWVNQIDTPAVIKERRGLAEKAVTRWDEDAVTMAVAAARASLENASISADELEAMYFGSCTNPYTSKASVLGVAETLTANPEMISADLQFATKSGTAVLQVCAALIDSGRVKYALAIKLDNGPHVMGELVNLFLDFIKKVVFSGKEKEKLYGKRVRMVLRRFRKHDNGDITYGHKFELLEKIE